VRIVCFLLITWSALLNAGCATSSAKNDSFQWLRDSSRKEVVDWLEFHHYSWRQVGSTIVASSPRRPAPTSAWVLTQDALEINFDESEVVSSVRHSKILTGP
jgi:hypothetical protein